MWMDRWMDGRMDGAAGRMGATGRRGQPRPRAGRGCQVRDNRAQPDLPPAILFHFFKDTERASFPPGYSQHCFSPALPRGAPEQPRGAADIAPRRSPRPAACKWHADERRSPRPAQRGRKPGPGDGNRGQHAREKGRGGAGKRARVTSAGGRAVCK